jgi:S1-C subfamily serine protease
MWKKVAVIMGLIMLALASSVPAQQANPMPPNMDSEKIASQVKGSVALVLVGLGAGRLEATGSAVVVKPNGYLLTAYHLVKSARQAQIRLLNGEVYDQVELLGCDERRDIAALHIEATGLPSLGVRPLDEVKQGEAAFTISNPAGLTWSVSNGIVSAIRLADEVPGAGSGFRVLQFTCPVAAGSSGGALVDAQGQLLGIVTASLGGQGLNFAVPAESVMGLINFPNHRMLGSGKELDLKPPESPVRASLNEAKQGEMLGAAKTLTVNSKTSFFTPDALENELAKKPELSAWGIKIVRDVRVADIIVSVDRPLFTYDFTYTATDTRTSIVLASGKVTAVDGVRAAPIIAKNLVLQMAKAHEATEPKPAKQ